MFTPLVIGLFSTLLVAGPPTDTRLADTAMQGNLDSVRMLLRQKIDVNAPQGDGMNALHWAAYQDDLEMLQLLLAAGGDVQAATRNGAITPLFLACANGNPAMIEALLKAGAHPNSINANGTTPLMTAASSGNPDAVRVLLDHGAAVNSKEAAHGQTALMFAAALNRDAVIDVLIARGADVNVATTSRETERIRFDQYGRVYYIRPTAVESPQQRPTTDEAAEAAAVEAVKSDLRLLGRALGFESAQILLGKPRTDGAVLLSPPVRVGPEFVGGMTALLYAAREGHINAARALVEAGADIN